MWNGILTGCLCAPSCTSRKESQCQHTEQRLWPSDEKGAAELRSPGQSLEALDQTPLSGGSRGSVRRDCRAVLLQKGRASCVPCQYAAPQTVFSSIFSSLKFQTLEHLTPENFRMYLLKIGTFLLPSSSTIERLRK